MLVIKYQNMKEKNDYVDWWFRTQDPLIGKRIPYPLPQRAVILISRVNYWVIPLLCTFRFMFIFRLPYLVFQVVLYAWQTMCNSTYI